MAYDVGDAILTFTGNTQNLDQAYEHVQAGAQRTAGVTNTAMAEMAAATDGFTERLAVGANGAQQLGEVVQLSGEKARFSMYEARGEAGLLGEEFGIKLPRHVRSFVAELPGVGEALSAAFAATAVLFLIEALIKGSEKLSEWVSGVFIFTEAMKESDQQIKDTNKSLIEEQKELSKLKLEYELAGLQGVAKLNKELQLLQVTMKDGRKSFEEAKEDLDDLTKHQATFEQKFLETQSFFGKANDFFKDLVGAQTQATAAYYKKLGEAQDEFILASKKNEVVEQEIANKKKERDAAAVKVHAEALKKQSELEKLVLKQKQNLQKEYEKSLSEEDKALEHHLDAQVKAELKVRTEFAKAIGEQLKVYQEELTEEESSLEGSTTRKAERLKRQFDVGLISGKKYLAEVKALYSQEEQELVKLINKKESLLNKDDAKELAQFKKLEDQKVKIGEQSALKIEQATVKAFSMSARATQAFSAAFTSAVEAMASGADTITQALGKIVQATLQAIAQQAGAEGAKQLALAFGAYPDVADMDHHFTSAGLWFALDAGLSAAGGAISGATSGGGGSYGGAPRGSSPTALSSGGVAGSGPVNKQNVQRFAAGGLVTGPTMAMIGDSYNRSAGQSEAVIPLDDERSLSKIREALGGGGGINIHMAIRGGVVSHETLKEVAGQISKKVRNGQIALDASNTFRVTRRGGGGS